MKIKALLVLATLFSASLALAQTRVSLVTISPGPIVFESFGHTALIVENADVSTGNVTVYEYGAVNPARVLSNPDAMAAFSDLFESKVKTNASKTVTPMAELSGGGRLPLVLKLRYLAPRADMYREITVNPLDLTEEQAAKLIELLDRDIAAGEYNYDNYSNNCATRVRDRLYDDAVLGRGERETIEGEQHRLGTSVQKLVLESIDEAIALNPAKKIELMPAALARSGRGRQAMMMLGMLGIKASYVSSREFYATVTNADSQLQSLMPGEPIARGFHSYFFAPQLSEQPISESRSMFMPKYLRAALLRASNAATGKPLIDPSKELKRTTTDELQALEAARAAALAQQPH